MEELNKRTPATSRGTWCNLCGARLARHERGAGLALPMRFARRTEAEGRGGNTRGGSGAGPTWSICSRCYQERMHCSSCGILVGRQAFMLEGDLRFYCRDCFASRPRCDTCDRPVGARYWSRPDGRKLCDRCQSTAVTDSHLAFALFGRVRHALASQLSLSLREPCQLRLVSRRQLLSMVDTSSLQRLDADSRGRCFGIFVRQGAHKAIFIEHGLPRIVLLEVMAHEYAHAWQSENCPPDAPLAVQEGFAEWVAYKLLASWGCYRRSDRMLRRDDLYGRGLRLVLGWEAAGGEREVFGKMRTSRLQRMRDEG